MASTDRDALTATRAMCPPTTVGGRVSSTVTAVLSTQRGGGVPIFERRWSVESNIGLLP